jgi:hypothetical protein
LTKTAYLKNATVKNRFEFLSQLSKRNLRIKYGFAFALRHCQPTDCVTCVWAGVDNAWEQEKLEARKMFENAAESHTSGARFVGLPFYLCATLAKGREVRQQL